MLSKTPQEPISLGKWGQQKYPNGIKGTLGGPPLTMPNMMSKARGTRFAGGRHGQAEKGKTGEDQGRPGRPRKQKDRAS